MESKTPISDEVAQYAQHEISGTAYWGNTPFRVAAVTQLADRLWVGCSPAEVGMPLPSYFKYVLNLYPWVSYQLSGAAEIQSVKLMDAEVPDEKQLDDLQAWVNGARQHGPTLVHCQVGLNRSPLIAGLVLVRNFDMTPDDAIAMLRKERSPAVLCNPAFEKWLREQA